jgi:hypothetical protein
MQALKVDSGWQQSVDDHTTMIAGDDKKRERAVDVAGSNKEGKGSTGNGE